MTTAVAPLSAVPKLAGAVMRYVAATPAPEPASITLFPDMNRVDFQPEVNRDPVQAIGALLVWTHRLTGITGTWSRTIKDGPIHATLTGRGPHGITFRVFTGLSYRPLARLITLPLGHRESVTPDELYRLALELRTGGAS